MEALPWMRARRLGPLNLRSMLGSRPCPSSKTSLLGCSRSSTSCVATRFTTYPVVMNFNISGQVNVTGPADPHKLQLQGTIKLDSGEVRTLATQHLRMPCLLTGAEFHCTTCDCIVMIAPADLFSFLPLLLCETGGLH